MAAKRRDLVKWAIETMVADVFYDGKLWVGMSEEGLVLHQGLKRLLALVCSRRK